MEFNSCILLYSKYSSFSKKLMDYIKTSGIDFTNLIRLQPLCVDNEKVRKRIIENSQIGISSVPCILLIYKDGGVEKYEGSSVFNWFEEIIKKFMKSQPQETKFIKDDSNNYKNESENLYKDNSYEKNSNVNNQNDQLMKHSKVPINTKVSRKDFKSISKSKSSKQVTNLEDLPSEEEEDNNQLYSKHDDTRKVNEIISVKKSSINNSNTQKSSDIMNKAKELAKGREIDPLPTGHPGRKEK